MLFSVYSHEITIFLSMAFILSQTLYTHISAYLHLNTYTQAMPTHTHIHASFITHTHTYIYISQQILAWWRMPSCIPFMFATCAGLTQHSNQQSKQKQQRSPPYSNKNQDHCICGLSISSQIHNVVKMKLNTT